MSLIRSWAGVIVGLVAVALLLTVGSTSVDAQTSDGPIIGAYAQPIGGQSNIDAIVALEDTLGTTLPIVRAFEQWESSIGEDKPLHRFVRDGGRDLAVSVKPERRDGTEIPWADIANARPGSVLYSEIQGMADSLSRYQAPVIFSFHHEAEGGRNASFGTSDEFIAAYRNIHSIFEAEGVTNVQYALILGEWSFEVGDFFPTDRRRAELWYPGDDVIDIIGSDEYNWNNCRGETTEPWTSLADDIEPFLRFANQHPDKQLLLGEFGSDIGSPGQKAEWLNDAQEWFSTSPDADRFVALLYFHDDGRGEGWPECEWWLDTSPSSTAAAVDWFNNERFRGRLGAPGTVHFCNGQPATIVGTAGNDVLTGTPGQDIIAGLAGNDTIVGLTGDDVICGGPGNDTIRGLGGADVILGEGGADFILGGFGPDTIFGGVGQDRINGQFGNDRIFGGDGNDTIRGGPHQDVINGGAHADRILGQGGFDTISGGQGNDVLLGGVGADTLIGNLGVDVCTGGDGRDTLTCETER